MSSKTNNLTLNIDFVTIYNKSVLTNKPNTFSKTNDLTLTTWLEINNNYSLLSGNHCTKFDKYSANN